MNVFVLYVEWKLWWICKGDYHTGKWDMFHWPGSLLLFTYIIVLAVTYEFFASATSRVGIGERLSGYKPLQVADW